MNPYLATQLCQEQTKQALIGTIARGVARRTGQALWGTTKGVAKGTAKATWGTAKFIRRHPGKTLSVGLGVAWPLGSALKHSPRQSIRPGYFGHVADGMKPPKLQYAR